MGIPKAVKNRTARWRVKKIGALAYNDYRLPERVPYL
jgi:hypothetical protein